MVRVLVISASMGAGHEGAARELARRVEARGGEAVVVDFLDAFPRELARAWRSFYLFQLRRMPESYESTYQLFYRHPRLWRPFVRFERALSGARTLQWVERYRPDVVVSTYSFATLVVGRLREEGRVTVPAVNFLTDFAVHPRAVHPAVDLNLAIHPVAADNARRQVDGRVLALGPAVDPAFRPSASSSSSPPSSGGRRAATREWLGVGDDRPLVLIVAGSWGIGDIPATVAPLVADGRFAVVTVCGQDEGLRRRLESEGLGRVLGWTDRMPEIMAATDVLVENAGGLTSLEAFACGVPVVSYRPIPGHGRDNIASMRRAGVTTVPADDAELVAAVDRLARAGPERSAQLAAAAAMFAGDPVDAILELVETVDLVEPVDATDRSARWTPIS
ncbi:MAG TPA: glycosyltransferase [Acidimicrobiia bacterium]|nr:glycosyltransferase [Acidimicrobiia bacterium]